jgi:hypothetical protein
LAEIYGFFVVAVVFRGAVHGRGCPRLMALIMTRS